MRKKVLVSLMYPCVLIVLVILLMVFLVTYVVPSFATLYNSMSAQLPTITLYLIAIGTAARNYVLVGAAAFVGLVALFLWWSRKESRAGEDRPRQDQGAAVRRHLDQISGGAVFARAEHAADRRHSADAGPRNGGRFARHAAVAEDARKGRARWCGKASRFLRRLRQPAFSPSSPST